ncbi:MAG: hypothetical protein D6798_07350 [Deltaproteobacteria bacterium]|nr:MAG: hypothetical protein D6798_07350 [Deltaproteobacteria bacterium]
MSTPSPSIAGRLPAHRRLRRILGRLALAAGGLVAGVALAEIGARLIHPAGNADLLFNAPDTTPRGLYLVDHELLLVPAPGFSAVSRGLDHRVPLRINSVGVRGPEPGEKRGERWLAIGDSFTLATQVAEADTFEQRLAALLSAPDARVEVFNAGVDGYSTWQATGRYTRLDGTLQADGALLTFFLGNDLQDNERFPMLLPDARRHPEGVPIPRPTTAPWTAWLTRNSYLYAHYRVWNRARALRGGRDPFRQQWRDELSIFTTGGRGRLQGLLPSTRRALQQLRDRVQRAGDRLMVAVAPPAFVVDRERVAPTFEVVGLDPATADLDAPGAAVLSTLSALHIPACDLTPALRAGARTDRMYLTYDGHWTPQGHAVVAEALATCMERR